MSKKQVTQIQLDSLASLTHGINNQLSGIRGLAELLFETCPEGQKASLSQILSCVSQAATLVAELQNTVYSIEKTDAGTSEVISLIHARNREELSGAILVVDDEPGVASVCAEILKTVGYAVLVANTGEEAVRIFEENASTLAAVVLDVELPYTHGSLVYARMQVIQPDVPVIAMSGFPQEHALIKMEGHRLAGFIKKPFDAAFFIKTVDNVISASRKSGDVQVANA